MPGGYIRRENKKSPEKSETPTTHQFSAGDECLRFLHLIHLHRAELDAGEVVDPELPRNQTQIVSGTTEHNAALSGSQTKESLINSSTSLAFRAGKRSTTHKDIETRKRPANRSFC